MKSSLIGAGLLALSLVPARSPGQALSSGERLRVDSAVVSVLSGTGAPVAAIAVVRGGEVVYLRGYRHPAAPGPEPDPAATRFAIGSVSKQFTAAAVLLLAEEGRLRLDDPVSRWFPTLTRAGEVTVRQLLSMTAGYQDYWPQDYVFPEMQRPVRAADLLERWAGKPLDFEPGSRWQYSNTNYVLAAAIVERLAGIPFMDFLARRIFNPLGMASVTDFDRGPLAPTDAAPWLRNAMGPFRPAPKEAPGWLFGAGQLAMTAGDLARWNVAVIRRSLLREDSYREQERDQLLGNGLSTRYGLGVGVSTGVGGRRRISHGGAVSGYTTTNEIYPDHGAAITVFTNIYPGAAGATGQIAGRIAGILFPATDSAAGRARLLARQVYDGLTRGIIDPGLLSENARAYFTAEVVADYAASLAPLGPPTEFAATGETLRGGMIIRSYRVRAGGITMGLTTMTLPDGRLEQFLIAREG